VPKWTTYCSKVARIWGVVSSTDVIGLGVWFRPDDKLKTNWSSLVKNALESPLKLGITGFNRYYSAIKAVNKAHNQITKNMAHWRIMHPSPSIYDKNVGNSLIKVLLQWAQVEGIAIYHEVFKEQHVDYFQEHGFECVKEFELPTKPPIKFWSLLKYPSK